MIYILVALKAEAQAFVDKYKLPKTKYNDEITIITSGIGSHNMFQATQKIVNNINENDIIMNIGICGASKKFQIGQLIDGLKENLTCVDNEISEMDKYELVDMESQGFIEATKDIKNRYIFKVVSDYFEPHKITKEKTKSLIFNVIDDINKIINFKANH